MTLKIPGVSDKVRAKTANGLLGGDVLKALANQLYVESNPDKFKQDENRHLLTIEYPVHPSGLNVEEAGKALFGAIAALPPIDQHRTLASMYNCLAEAMLGSIARASKS